ncbi:hypothetical protein [Arthrobacter psychrolactophilus]
MAAALNDVHDEDAGLFERNQVLGNACFTGADGIHDIATWYWAVFLQEPNDFVAPTIAESLNVGFDIVGSSQIYRVRDLRHVPILPHLSTDLHRPR